MVTFNNRIAVSPFKDRHVKTKVTGGVAVIENKTILDELEVVFKSHDAYFLDIGDKVYVRGDAYAHQWAKEVYELNGIKYILIPKDFVMAYKHVKDAKNENL